MADYVIRRKRMGEVVSVWLLFLALSSQMLMHLALRAGKNHDLASLYAKFEVESMKLNQAL